MFIIIFTHSCIGMTDPLSPPGPEPSEERVKARGRGLGILMVIRPSITKKDIHPIRQSMERALSDSFASVELSYFPRDPTSTHLKIVVDLAKFRLSPADVVPWYSRLLERFLLQFQQDLKELHHSIEDVQVAFLTRYSPREKEGDLIPVPTPEETSALQPDLARILAPPVSPSPTKPDEAARITGTPSTDTPTPGKQTSSVPWLERDLADPEERPYRFKTLQEYRENRFEEGVQTCVSGLEIYPNSPFLLYLLSTLLIAQKKDREALSILDHLITVYPDCAEAYLQRSKVRFRLGDSSGSEHDRAKARELNPDLVVGQ
jgi:tetratricopeptide (TPR) repeat protein